MAHKASDFIDTGAAESIISIDAVDDLFNSYESEDQIRFMTAIGGRETFIRRRIDQIGLDLLIPGRFIIDLHNLAIYTTNSK